MNKTTISEDTPSALQGDVERANALKLHLLAASSLPATCPGARNPESLGSASLHGRGEGKLFLRDFMEVRSKNNHNVHACMLSHFSHVWLFGTPWTVDHQAPLSMGFFGQEYWSELPCPTPGNIPNPGIKPSLLISPALGCLQKWWFC